MYELEDLFDIMKVGCHIICGLSTEQRIALDFGLRENNTYYDIVLGPEYRAKKFGPIKLRPKSVLNILKNDKELALKGDEYIKRRLQCVDCWQLKDLPASALSIEQRERIKLIIDVENNRLHHIINVKDFDEVIIDIANWLMNHHKFKCKGNLVILTEEDFDECEKSLKAFGFESYECTDFFEIDEAGILVKYDSFKKREKTAAKYDSVKTENKETTDTVIEKQFPQWFKDSLVLLIKAGANVDIEFPQEFIDSVNDVLNGTSKWDREITAVFMHEKTSTEHIDEALMQNRLNRNQIMTYIFAMAKIMAVLVIQNNETMEEKAVSLKTIDKAIEDALKFTDENYFKLFMETIVSLEDCI
ncbi:MAG: hypothetical protein IJN77_04280 [Oscillospiraceae bacterium]|nr:hypothetical protein [Oscillospiraceae bacterium]